MTTPTKEHFDGFFHGMAHALSLCEANKRGKTSAQAQAIRREIVTLSLMYERWKRKVIHQCVMDAIEESERITRR